MASLYSVSATYFGLILFTLPKASPASKLARCSRAYPDMQLIALSMNNSDDAIIKMLKAGCCVYLLKDTHPTELEKALMEITSKGYYNADAGNLNFRRLLIQAEEKKEIKLSARELQFLQLACSDLTYKEVAA